VNAFALTEPILTERLLLRAYREDDLGPLHEMLADPEIVRYLYWEPHSLEEARVRLEQKLRRTTLRAPGDVLALAAESRETGAFVADVVLTWSSGEHACGEIGYLVHPARAGKGFATEATRPLLPIAFAHVGLHRVIGRLEARNTASARVLEKLGFRREAHLVENEWVKGEWQSELVYAMLEREWRAQAT
jgi:RimJ/RimL family protein N-acetyltransferase